VFKSECPHYSLALFSRFICTCTTSKKIEFASKRTLCFFAKKSPEYANNRVKKLVIYYNITATLCSNVAIIEAIMAGTYSLKRFLKNTPSREKHKDK